MQWLLIVPGYLAWHYSRGYRDFLHVWGNIVWFVFSLFAVPHHLVTLLSPWHRMLEEKPARFEVERWAEGVVVNIMSRLIGFTVRVVIIVAGVASLLTSLTLGIVLLLAWAAFPVVPAVFFLIGITLVTTV
jgi:hypothetical protein